jgi:hypothetical protein
VSTTTNSWVDMLSSCEIAPREMNACLQQSWFIVE